MKTVGDRVELNVLAIHAVGPGFVELIGIDRLAQRPHDPEQLIGLTVLGDIEKPRLCFGDHAVADVLEPIGERGDMRGPDLTPGCCLGNSRQVCTGGRVGDQPRCLLGTEAELIAHPDRQRRGPVELEVVGALERGEPVGLHRIQRVLGGLDRLEGVTVRAGGQRMGCRPHRLDRGPRIHTPFYRTPVRSIKRNHATTAICG